MRDGLLIFIIKEILGIVIVEVIIDQVRVLKLAKALILTTILVQSSSLAYVPVVTSREIWEELLVSACGQDSFVILLWMGGAPGNACRLVVAHDECLVEHLRILVERSLVLHKFVLVD